TSGYDCVAARCVPSSLDSIGPEGGVLISPDRRLTLDVPPGALSSRVHLTMEFAESWPAGGLGPVFDVRPTGTAFAAPVTSVYRFQQSDIAPHAAASVRLGVASGSSWSRFVTIIDAVGGMVTV